MLAILFGWSVYALFAPGDFLHWAGGDRLLAIADIAHTDSDTSDFSSTNSNTFGQTSTRWPLLMQKSRSATGCFATYSLFCRYPGRSEDKQVGDHDQDTDKEADWTTPPMPNDRPISTIAVVHVAQYEDAVQATATLMASKG